MKVLFYAGLVVIILGVVSLVVPTPRRERQGISVGGVSIGVETRSEETVHPALSGIMILGGLGVMAMGRRRAV